MGRKQSCDETRENGSADRYFPSDTKVYLVWVSVWVGVWDSEKHQFVKQKNTEKSNVELKDSFTFKKKKSRWTK